MQHSKAQKKYFQSTIFTSEASVNSAKSGHRALNILKCLLSKYCVKLSEMYTLRILLLSNLVQSVQAVQLTVGLNVLGFFKQLILFYRIFFLFAVGLQVVQVL